MTINNRLKRRRDTIPSIPMGIESRIVPSTQFVPLYQPYAFRHDCDPPSEARGGSRLDHRYNLTPDTLEDRYTWTSGKYPTPYLLALSRYWQQLSRVSRWSDGDKPIHSRFSENDAEHTAECVRMIKRYGEQSPRLSATLNFTDAAIMATWHDGGEIELGDVAITSSGPKQRPHVKSEQELEVLKRSVLESFPEQDKVAISSHAERYLRREQKWLEGKIDPEAEFTKLIDIAQGVGTAMEHFYPNPHQIGAHRNGKIVRERVRDSVLRLFRGIRTLDDALFQKQGNKMDSTAFSEWRVIVVDIIRPLTNAEYIGYSLEIVQEELPSMLALLQDLTAAEDSEMQSGTAYPLTDSRMI